MEKKLTALRETLSDYRDDYSLCGKCKLCHASHVHEIDRGRFWRNCPAGSRFRFDGYYASGRLEMARALELGEIEPTPALLHSLYACTLCGNCQEQCYPVKQLYPMRVFELMREKAVREGWGPLPEHLSALDNLEKTDNLFGRPKAERERWSDGLGLRDAARKGAEVLLFAGCRYSLQPELAETARSAVRVLRAAGLEVGSMGSEELCCGAPLLELGDRDFFEAFAAENIRRMKAVRADLIVTLCPHCAWVMAEEYAPELDAEIKPATEVVAEVLREERFWPQQELSGKAAWHDPCRLGRRLRLYDAPREILDCIPGLERVEFQRSRGSSLCCGNGGMAGYAFPDYEEWTAAERIYEAECVGAAKVVTACPWCEEMLGRGARSRGSDVTVENVFSLLWESLGGDGS